MAGRYEEGMAMRRRVLGDAHVQRSLDAASEFSQPMQDLVTEYCWGAVWSRPGLAPRDRSLVNLGMLVALNRPDELRVHLRGALGNGVTVAEIQEVLLQAGVYCGMPAALDAFRIAGAVIEEHEAGGGE
jgi:4-carboxymuconolactone decarboxylase